MRLRSLIALHGDAMQGAGEQRTEVYGQYSEGAVQPATPQSAPSASSAAGSAGGQAGAVRGEEGLASIVVVSVLIIILTLISLGFARLISRSINNANNRQFSAAATYAAQSGINDVAAYLKQYVDRNGSDSFLPKSTKCNGAGSLIGNAVTPGPFYDESNLSGDSGTRYTCLLLDPTPNSLVYTQVANLKSQVVKINTSAAAGALDRLMISWQPSNSQITGYPLAMGSLSDETTWNKPTAACKDNQSPRQNSSCIPILRMTMYPISNGETLDSTVQAQSKTLFLYPQTPSGNVPLYTYGNNVNFKDGSLIGIPCTQTVGVNTFNPSTNSDYKCNIIVGGLATAIAPAATDSVYLRLTPIYNQADIKIQANDKFGDSLSFVNDQAVIDVTAQTAGVAKRLQARVDTSSLASNSGGVDTNISSISDGIPEQSLRTAIALCKREIQVAPSNGFPSYVAFDNPENVCHTLGEPITIENPVPKLTLNITGKNGKDNGLTVDSEANNPDSPQNPVQKGTVYVGIDQASPNGNIQINWSTTDASSCMASGGSGGDGWAGDQTGSMTFSGKDGTGTFPINGVTSVTEYDLACTRPLAPGPSATKKVFAWPHPVVAFNPISVTAGQAYSLSWKVSNSTSCTAGGDSGANGAWTGSQSSSTSPNTFNKGLGTWPWNDNSTKTYTITCKDPVGRSATASIVLGPGQSDTCDGANSSCSNKVNPPACNGDWNVSDNGDGTGNLSFNGACPPPPDDPTRGYYRFTDCSADFVSKFLNPVAGKNCGDGVGNAGGPFKVGTGTYCATYWTGADPWGWLSSKNHCFTINPPPIVLNASKVGAYFFVNGPGDTTCHDNVHQYIACFSWNVYQDDRKPHGIPGTGVNFPLGQCRASATSAFGGGGSTFGATRNAELGIDKPGAPPANPNVFNYWNVTFGWDVPPGNVSITITCTSPAPPDGYGGNPDPYGSKSTTLTFDTTEFVCSPSGSCGGSGGGGGGGGGGIKSEGPACYDDGGAYLHNGPCTAFEMSWGAVTKTSCFIDGIWQYVGSCR